MDYQKIIEQIILALIPILIPILCAYLIAQAKKAWSDAKAYAPTVTDKVEAAARFAVMAVEQLKRAGVIEPGDIATAKETALSSAERWLEANGVRVDLHLLDDAIESAVWDCLNRDKELPEPQ